MQKETRRDSRFNYLHSLPTFVSQFYPKHSYQYDICPIDNTNNGATTEKEWSEYFIRRST